MLVDAMGTVAEAEALADWVALHNRNLETIYITHAHFDHFYGLSILLDRFPGARAIATPKTVKAMQMSFTPTVERLARRMFPGQVATKLVAPEPYEPDTFTLEGHELRIIEQGRTDSPDSTSLYVPSIGLIVAGDVVYNQCRMYVGDTTPESRKNWIADLDRLAALNPTIVVAGHKKPGAPDSPSAIQDTKRYLEDFDRLQKTATSDQELFDQMTELYPHWVANQSWLMFGFPGAISYRAKRKKKAASREDSEGMARTRLTLYPPGPLRHRTPSTEMLNRLPELEIRAASRSCRVCSPSGAKKNEMLSPSTFPLWSR